MHVARWIVVSILIVAVVFTYNLPARHQVSQFWDHARPQVLQLMDGLYIAIRNFVAGSDVRDGIEEHPPGVDYDHIITMNYDVFL